MDIKCNKCQTVSSIPDSAIPSEGLYFECPHCSAQLFAKPDSGGLEDELLFEDSSLSLDMGMNDSDPSVSLDDINEDSLAIDLKELGDDDISPSMIYNTEELVKENKIQEPKLELQSNTGHSSPPENKFSEKKDINNIVSEEEQSHGNPKKHEPVAVPQNTLNSYLDSRSASVQEEKAKMSPVMILLMAFLILGGAGGYYFYFMKDKNLNRQMVMTPELKKELDKTYNDNPGDYRKVFNFINSKLAQNPNHILYKAAYVYVAGRYFTSIETTIKSFAPDYDSYYGIIKKFSKKSTFIKKAVIYYELSKLFDKKRDITQNLKVRIQNLPVNDPDTLQLKAFIFYKNKAYEKLKKLVNGSNTDKNKMIPSYFILLKSEFYRNESISLLYNKIKEINPKHIYSMLYNVKYLLKYNQLKDAKKELMELEKLKAEMSSYELTMLYLLNAKLAEMKLELKEAYSLVKTAEDLKVKNDDFFKEILNFYYRNYYNDAALGMLKNTYKARFSKDFEVGKIYINLLIRDGDFARAGQISTELKNKYPKRPETYYLAALLSDSLGNTSLAIESLEKALSLNNKYQDAVVLLSKEYLKKGKHDKALKLLEDYLKDFKDNTKVKYGLALLCYKDKNYRKAYSLYNSLLTEKLTKEEKSDIHFRMNMIDYFTGKQNIKTTLNNLYAIYKSQPNFKELRIQIAKLEIKIKHYDKAVKLLKEELKIRSKNIEANLYLGIAYYYKKDYVMAEDLLNKTISLDGKNHKAFYYLGKTYLELNKMNKALNAFSSAYSYDKNNYDYLIELARIHRKLNHADEAFEAYSKLVKIKADYQALFEYGSLFLKQNDTKNALKYFNMSYSLNPDNINLILEMGNLFFKIQEYKKALNYYKKAIKLDKRNAEAYYMIGEIYRSKEKFKKAIPYYLKAIKFDPKQGKYYYQLGYMYKGMKQYKKALKIFRLYLKKIPDTPDKSEIMDEIYDLQHL